MDVRTERLDLRPVTPNDCQELFAIFTDPAGWWFEPENRHLELVTTERFIERAAARWTNDGLSYWSVRLRDADQVIGIGGAQRHRTGAWNLSYRIATDQQGQGYAVELGIAGLEAARACDNSVPVIAWVAEQNTPSRRVAERIGLQNRGLFTDQNDGKQRLAFADREYSGV
ncbi:RimJ/RimL family protein N-acetyltransferase [Psychromicrobium silvestre]|uniref:RimJ/RimL family protein N-acetyltransferase n=1 Tax=Psychromicrobium silvestre TaxID=1645614 RepID=A0A7Y9LRF9_9MICC|nr:GNAT family N-acetyltransferase [Psychromicrobium silvestre]NYE94224.1 RimJ/RimL family protein N-acetyltransferase [Psychromicrobium silvestre]